MSTAMLDLNPTDVIIPSSSSSSTPTLAGLAAYPVLRHLDMTGHVPDAAVALIEAAALRLLDSEMIIELRAAMPGEAADASASTPLRHEEAPLTESILLQIEADGLHSHFKPFMRAFIRKAQSAGTEVVIGSELARKLNIHAGSVVQLMVSTAHGGINATDAQVVGVMSTGNKDLDERIVNVTFGAAQALLRTDRASRFTVFLRHTSDAAQSAATLRSTLPTMDVRTWDQLVSLYHQIVSLYRNQFSVFGAILSVTILLSMSNWILMSVMERRREISTLRALGVPSVTVRSVLVKETALLGLLGAFAGIAVSVLLMSALNHAGIHLPPPPGRVNPILLTFAISPSAVAAVEAAFVVLGIAAALLATTGFARRDILKGFAS